MTKPATVAFKDVCLDAAGPDKAARFWSAVLGLSARARDGLIVLSDEVDEHTLWINPVPEPKSVKHRVHLDVHAATVADLTSLGARVLDNDQPWTVLADPEGGEFCAFVRRPEDLPAYRLYELGVDAEDPERMAVWWAARFGIEAQQDPESAVWFLAGAPGMPWEMVFAAVPEPKRGKNRVHWDVTGDPAALLQAGATLVRPRDDEIAWDVLADPEGNEFCVFAPGAS